MLKTFTGVLDGLGFASAGESMTGHQHRWIRGAATVDVLIPRFTGERTEKLKVVCGGAAGTVNRTTFLGCLVGKAAAMTIVDDPGSQRHVEDFLTLATVLRARDLRGAGFGSAERGHLSHMLGLLTNNPSWRVQIPESQTGLDRLRIALN
ncbi:hypothetical protein [Arthrobacter sp. H5]|uniref:hypothetical protein n=1 Tax=Arthrobacter sp. H5 TaxID=1267973 RepID=UPI0004B365E5|nr:hypothetical protein [Arthrobacter sp. H5]